MIDRQIAELVGLIERSYISTPTDYRPIEFAHKVMYFAIDVISGIGYGAPVGFLANDKDMYRYVETNQTAMPMFALFGNMPWLALLLKRWPFSAMLPKDSDPQGFGRMIRYVVQDCAYSMWRLTRLEATLRVLSRNGSKGGEQLI